jgi:RNA polymerase sigma-70 factor (ECF subfamily)
MTEESGETSRLLERARGGEPRALEDLYSRLGPRLLGLIRLRLGRGLRSHLESQDILQACLLKSFERLPELRADNAGQAMAWLARIAENEIRDRADFHGRQRRDAGREVALDPAFEPVATRVKSALSEIIFDEQAARLEAAIAGLTPDQREVVILRKFHDLSFAEIGERMGRSEDASRMLLARAMTALTLALASDDEP